MNQFGGYSDYKQEALWQHSNGLYQESVNYQDFDNQVRPKNGLDPKDATELDSVTTKVNRNSGQYTVGPFKITYTEGIYGGIAFGGIHDMKVVGYNAQGAVVRDDIEIEKFVLNNEEKTPEYFEPIDIRIDETEQVYPESDQEFEVIFKDPNAGLDVNDPNRVVAIGLDITFQYMMANGKKTDFTGWKYDPVTYYHEDDGYHNHYDEDGNITRSNCYYCEKEGIYPPVSKQPTMCADAIRTLYEQKIRIPEEGPFPKLFMNLGGYVWEEILQGKNHLLMEYAQKMILS